jgi:hypothetical protein
MASYAGQLPTSEADVEASRQDVMSAVRALRSAIDAHADIPAEKANRECQVLSALPTFQRLAERGVISQKEVENALRSR